MLLDRHPACSGWREAQLGYCTARENLTGDSGQSEGVDGRALPYAINHIEISMFLDVIEVREPRFATNLVVLRYTNSCYQDERLALERDAGDLLNITPRSDNSRQRNTGIRRRLVSNRSEFHMFISASQHGGQI